MNLIPHEDDDHLMTVKEFHQAVRNGSFIDYDGYGVWATKSQKLEGLQYRVFPSEFQLSKVPVWATHIVWYNR